LRLSVQNILRGLYIRSAQKKITEEGKEIRSERGRDKEEKKDCRKERRKREGRKGNEDERDYSAPFKFLTMCLL
jgi:hypothetical protein